MDLSDIQAAVSSLGTAVSAARGILDLSATAEVKAKVAELQDALLAAQGAAISATQAQMALVAEVQGLKEQLKEFQDWGGQESRYALISPFKNAGQVYALKQEAAGEEKPHFLCTNCFQGKKKVMLNPSGGWGGIPVTLNCPACEATIHTGLVGIGSARYAEEYGV